MNKSKISVRRTLFYDGKACNNINDAACIVSNKMIDDIKNTKRLTALNLKETIKFYLNEIDELIHEDEIIKALKNLGGAPDGSNTKVQRD